MRKLRTITVTELDEAGEIAALKAEASRRSAEVGDSLAPFEVCDVVRIATGRRSAPKGTLAAIVATADFEGDYTAVYLDANGDFRLTMFKRNQAEPYTPEPAE
jgi:hypothetical protein